MIMCFPEIVSGSIVDLWKYLSFNVYRSQWNRFLVKFDIGIL